MILKNAKVNDKLIDIKIEDGKIIALGTFEGGDDLGGKKVIPGLIDIHTHGCMGVEAMDRDFAKMSKYYLENGITSYLPTTSTCSVEDIRKVLETDTNVGGANILGFHLEGPYISDKYIGAQNGDHIKNPDVADFNEYDNVKMMTLAPELSGSIEFIKNAPYVIVLGHTACSYDTAVEAIDAGANCVTHIFNALAPLHHREPGPIGAAFDKKIYAQIISDGIHVHPAVVRMTYDILGEDRMVLISDSMQATGLTDGDYSLGGRKVIVKDNVARCEDGALAGSTSNLWQCVKKAYEFGIPFDSAVKMASETPAKLLGIKKGKIYEGYDADLLILDDNLEIEKIILGGEFVK